jgi:hypothetical protein
VKVERQLQALEEGIHGKNDTTPNLDRYPSRSILGVDPSRCVGRCLATLAATQHDGDIAR